MKLNRLSCQSKLSKLVLLRLSLLKQEKNLSTLTSAIEFCQASYSPVSRFASGTVLQSTVMGKSQCEAEKPALPGELSYSRRSAFSTEKGTLITTGYNLQVEL